MPNFRNRNKCVQSFQVAHRAAGLPARFPAACVGRYSGECVQSMAGALRQRTVLNPVQFNGVGLHSGVDVTVLVRPTPAGGGIVFHRVDLRANLGADGAAITATPGNVIGADHGATIANNHGASVSTIEHLMAAFSLCGVDNAVVEVDGPEIPICDGSSAQFVSAIVEAGLKEQAASRIPLIVTQPFSLRDGERSIEIEPYSGRRVEIEIVFDDCMIGRQALVLDLEDPDVIARLSAARTFCRLHEVDALRSAGLIRGGGLNNSLVVDGDRLLNTDPLRDPAEFALHKALDLIGDLYLLGAPIVGLIRATRPGHDLNTRAALALFDQFGHIAHDAAAGDARRVVGA